MDDVIVNVRQVLCLDARRKYLLILVAFLDYGTHSREMTKEIQIECEPDDLVNRIQGEKRSYEARIQKVLDAQSRRW